MYVCRSPQKGALLHMGKNTRSPSTQPHADGRSTYSGVGPGSPSSNYLVWWLPADTVQFLSPIVFKLHCASVHIRGFTTTNNASNARNKDRVNTSNVHGSVHRKNIPIHIQQDVTLHSLFISGNCSTRFGWYLHPSSGAHATVSTASGICHIFTATCRYRGRVGTDGH